MTTRPCWAEIGTGALEQNYRFLRQLGGPGIECLAIVKANAYGHGLELCAPAAVRGGARWLGVTSVEEGATARAVCPDARILVMGGAFPGQAAAAFGQQLTPVVWEPWQLDELEAYARANGLPAGCMPVHLEIDTGMSRQGVSLEGLPALMRQLAASPALRIEAVMTHLYGSDEAHGEATPAQLARLEEALAILRAYLPSNLPASALQPEYLSVGASAALLGGGADAIRALAGRHALKPMLRLGLALYGVVPRFDPDFVTGEVPTALQAAREHLRPVLSWKTRIVNVRDVAAGTQVGYNGTFVATEPMRLALLAVGYADGLDRCLGNRFSLLVRGQRAPAVGRISMDQTVIDVTEIPEVTPGEEVVILGPQSEEEITAFDHAETAGTIPWEVFTRIASRVQRVEVGAS